MALFDVPRPESLLLMHPLMFGKLQLMVSFLVCVEDVRADTPSGYYEQQDDKQVEHNLRGKFFTDENGEYSFYCLRPTPYPVPFDGPAGKILQLLDRHPYRPAHIHLIVSHNE